MSAEVIDLPARRRALASGLRPEIRAVLEKMSGHLARAPGFVATPAGFAFDCNVGRTTVEFRTVDLPLPDGHRVTEVAEVRTEFRDALQDITPAEMAHFNRLACLGALLRDPATGRATVVTRCPFLAGNDGVLHRYGLLLNGAALAHGDQLTAAFCAAEGRPVPPEVALPRRPADQVTPWRPAEFEALARLMERAGLAATACAQGLVATVPWPQLPGVALDGDRDASLLTLSTGDPHPVLGDGLLCRLELPMRVGGDAAVDLVNTLNVIESQALDAEPSFGAWCLVPGAPRIAWVSFIPDTMFMAGLVGSVSALIVCRARGVPDLIGSRRV